MSGGSCFPSSSAGEALPPPLDISPGPRAEWDFNPPDTSAVRHTLRSSPPLPAASVLSASQFRCLYLFPWHRRTGSQVPYESPNESHASYTPGTAWPVGRFPPHSSWSSSATPVLMPPKAFRCVTRGSLPLISLIHT